MSSTHKYQEIDEITHSSVIIPESISCHETSRGCHRLCMPTRYVIVCLAALGFTMVYFLRINLSVALVVMVNSSALHPPEINGSNECPTVENATLQPKQDGPYMWDATQQGLILASFFWGYIPLQIPAGIFSEKFGGKWVFGLGVLWTSLLTLLTPLAAEAGCIWLILLRTLEGIGESVTYPAASAILSKWCPPKENSFMSAITYSGSIVGMVVGTLISGYLIDWGVLGGWPSVFYIPGVVGALWFIVWSICASSEPATHPSLSQTEKDFIEKSIGLSGEYYTLRIPWWKILTSGPVWAIAISSITFFFSINTLLSCLPQYFKYVLNLSIDQNGLLSSLPFLLMGISSVGVSKICDVIRSRELVSTITIRRLVNTIGMLGNAGFLIAVGYVKCDHTLALLYLCMASFLINFTSAGFSPNHLDLSPKYAGTLYGITNSVGSLSGIVAPILVGALAYKQTRLQWQKVFYITAGVSGFGAIFYLLFSSADRQTWSGDNNERLIEDSQ